MTQQIHALYVDDEIDLLDIGKRYLERQDGLSITTCMRVDDALRILEEQPFDLIISDYQMPVMNGISFLKYLRKAGNTTPFILFTGRGREEVVIEVLKNGADFFTSRREWIRKHNLLNSLIKFVILLHAQGQREIF